MTTAPVSIERRCEGACVHVGCPHRCARACVRACTHAHAFWHEATGPQACMPITVRSCTSCSLFHSSPGRYGDSAHQPSSSLHLQPSMSWLVASIAPMHGIHDLQHPCTHAHCSRHTSLSTSCKAPGALLQDHRCCAAFAKSTTQPLCKKSCMAAAHGWLPACADVPHPQHHK